MFKIYMLINLLTSYSFYFSAEISLIANILQFIPLTCRINIWQSS